MQINTELSPIVSPKSNFSNSFMSPRDNVLVNFTSKRIVIPPPDKMSSEIQKLRNENLSLRDNLETSYQNNDTATNESYSMDRYQIGDCSSRFNLPINTSNMIIVNENSTERALQPDDDVGGSRIENMHIIEFEEFVLEKEEPKTLETEKAHENQSHEADNQDLLVEERPQEEKNGEIQDSARENFQTKTSTSQLEPQQQPEGIPEPKINKRKKFNFPTITVPDDFPPQDIPNKQKVDKADFPLQDSKFNLTLEGPCLSRKESLKEPQSEITKQFFSQCSKNEEYQNSLLKEINDLKNSNIEKDEQIKALKEELEKEMLQRQSLMNKIEELTKENSNLNQEIIRATQLQKETEIENLRLKEKCENQV